MHFDSGSDKDEKNPALASSQYPTPFMLLDLKPCDDALISYGSFMQTKHLCVLIHIWTKGEIDALWNQFKPSNKIF